MTKHRCAICGAEVGLLQQIKLRDNHFVCGRCAARTHPLFTPVNVKTLLMFQEHLKQLEAGKVLYETLFVPRKRGADNSMKLKSLSAGMEVAEDIGLFSITRKRGGFLFWSGTPYYMVFCLADLFKYDYSSETKTGSDGKTEIKHYINFSFRNTPGLDAVKVNVVNERTYTLAAKYFNECFGIQIKL